MNVHKEDTGSLTNSFILKKSDGPKVPSASVEVNPKSLCAEEKQVSLPKTAFSQKKSQYRISCIGKMSCRLLNMLNELG